MRVLGYGAIRLPVAHSPWSVNLGDFQQHLLFSLRFHITVPILAFQNEAIMRVMAIRKFVLRVEETDLNTRYETLCAAMRVPLVDQVC